jgi:hypothetical protein
VCAPSPLAGEGGPRVSAGRVRGSSFNAPPHPPSLTRRTPSPERCQVYAGSVNSPALGKGRQRSAAAHTTPSCRTRDPPLAARRHASSRPRETYVARGVLKAGMRRGLMAFMGRGRGHDAWARSLQRKEGRTPIIVVLKGRSVLIRRSFGGELAILQRWPFDSR